LDIKRLNEIKAKENPSLLDIIEVVTDNFLSTSRHSKEIKKELANIMEALADVSQRISLLEEKHSNIFQIEMVDDSPDDLSEDEEDDQDDEEELTEEN
jgi:hypothetical protein